jgi:DNA-binding CsgD family transcriptional regulator
MQEIASTNSVKSLADACQKLGSYKHSIYHHIPAIGTYDFESLNRYWTIGLNKNALEYLQEKTTNLAPIITYVFRQSQPFWLSELAYNSEFKSDCNRQNIDKALRYLGDGILSPLFGPQHRSGYIYIAFQNPREFYDPIFIWQIQSILQAIHIRYCLLIESLRAQVNLTKRESEVLALITFGKTNPEIGQSLGISANTVAGHVKRIFFKFSASDRVTVALKAQSMLLGKIYVGNVTKDLFHNSI